MAVGAGLLTVLIAIGLGYARLMREPDGVARRRGRGSVLRAWLIGTAITLLSAFALLVAAVNGLALFAPEFLVPPALEAPVALR